MIVVRDIYSLMHCQNQLVCIPITFARRYDTGLRHVFYNFVCGACDTIVRRAPITAYQVGTNQRELLLYRMSVDRPVMGEGALEVGTKNIPVNVGRPIIVVFRNAHHMLFVNRRTPDRGRR